MMECSSSGPLAMQTVKLYHKPDCVSFDAFGRVVSGTIKVGDQVSVLGEGYTLDDDEDMTVKTVMSPPNLHTVYSPLLTLKPEF